MMVICKRVQDTVLVTSKLLQDILLVISKPGILCIDL